MRKRLLAIATILLVCALAFVAYRWCTRVQRELRFKTTDVKVTDSDLDISFGADTAQLTVYMFATYTCRHCRAFLNQDLPLIKNRYIDSGRVRLVIKPIDLGENRDMMYAIQLAGCMNRDGNADDILELLLTEPDAVYSEEFSQLIDDIIGSNPELAECLVADDFSYIKKNNSIFSATHSKGTPIFVIGGHLYSGRQKIDRFCKIIDYESNRVNILFN